MSAGPRGPWTYVLVVWAAVAGLGALSQIYQPLSREDLVPLLTLLALGVLGWVLPDTLILLSGDGVRISFLGIVVLAAAVLVGPVGGGLVGLLVTLARPTRTAAIRRLFNAGMLGVIGLVSGLVYYGVGGVDPLTITGTTAIMVHIALPLLAANVAQAVTNAVVLSGMMAVASGAAFWVQVRTLLVSASGLAYIAYGVVAFLLVVLWGPGHIQWFAAVLTIVLLLVARWSFDQLGEELRSHERTSDTLIAALDVRHPGAAAHAQRVAILCDWIGESLRVTPKALGELRTAGLLHDVGLLAVRHADRAAVRAHPATGAQMLTGISFVAPVLPAIEAHHERLDGSGYPRRLSGSSVPLEARIIAVADEFDALTMGTTDLAPLSAEKALLRLRDDPGLDPDVVLALVRAAERHGFASAHDDHWLSLAKFGPTRQAAADRPLSPTFATIAMELSHDETAASWITRHDHPDDRLGL